jgi:hypothetical protein
MSPYISFTTETLCAMMIIGNAEKRALSARAWPVGTSVRILSPRAASNHAADSRLTRLSLQIAKRGEAGVAVRSLMGDR